MGHWMSSTIFCAKPGHKSELKSTSRKEAECAPENVLQQSKSKHNLRNNSPYSQLNLLKTKSADCIPSKGNIELKPSVSLEERKLIWFGGKVEVKDEDTEESDEGVDSAYSHESIQVEEYEDKGASQIVAPLNNVQGYLGMQKELISVDPRGEALEEDTEIFITHRCIVPEECRLYASRFRVTGIEEEDCWAVRVRKVGRGICQPVLSSPDTPSPTQLKWTKVQVDIINPGPTSHFFGYNLLKDRPQPPLPRTSSKAFWSFQSLKSKFSKKKAA